MSDRSKIEWCDATWNPIRGCSRVSDGCRHCYAEIMAARFSDPGQWGHGFATRNPPRWTGRTALIEDKLEQPLRWRNKPRRIFVNSTSELFHENLDDAAIDRVFAVMAMCPQHTFLILTKRPERMRAWVTADRRDLINSHAGEILDWSDMPSDAAWPLSNLWLGVSVENQATANERIPHLLATPAAKRFVSYEPALGPVDFSRIDPNDFMCLDALGPVGGGGLDWVIAGGESGPKARPPHPDWFRAVRDQCHDADVPFFFKQWGEWCPQSQAPEGICLGAFPSKSMGEPNVIAEDTSVWKIGKQRAGRALDGREWNEVPA